MRALSFFAALLLASGTAATTPAAGLAKIDRAIHKEPAYQGQPKYCLLVFGPEAKFRVWLVRDGDVLYVDRNGNGDLTEKGERHVAAMRPDGIKWPIGDVLEADGRTRHTDLRVEFRRGSYALHLRTADNIHQEVGNEFGPLRFSDKAQDAPLVHLAGPLTFLLPKRAEHPLQLIPGKELHFIALIGTAGLGEGSTAYCHADDFEKLRMVVEVEFPHQAPDAPRRVRYAQDDY
jgi:hypothetical protein